VPYYIPTTAPVSATNEFLSTTITSGGGTNNLTVANTSSNAVAGNTILFDNSPTITAAYNAAVTELAPFRLPPPPNNASFYIINSPMTLGSGEIDFFGNLYLNDTLILSGSTVIQGMQVQNGSTTQFRLQPSPTLYTARGNPAVMTSNSNGLTLFQNVMITEAGSASGNGSLQLLQDGGNVVMKQGGFALIGNGYTSIGMETRGNLVGTSISPSANRFSDTTFVAAQIGVGLTNTPIYFSNFGPAALMDTVYLSGKGLYFRVAQPGNYVQVDKLNYSQGGYMPYFSFFTLSNGTATLNIANLIQDTTTVPLAVDFGGVSLAVTLSSSFGSISQPIVQGVGTFPLSFLVTGGSTQLKLPSLNTESGVVTALTFNPSFSTTSPGNYGSKPLNASLGIGASYNWFVRGTTPATPTACSATAGGTFLVGTFPYTYAPVFPDGSEGEYSASCSITTTSGFQTINMTLTAVPSAIGYNVYANGSRASCSVPGFTTTTVVYSGSLCGVSQTAYPSGGPTGGNQFKIWTPVVSSASYILQGPGGFNSTFSMPVATANRTVTVPDVSGATVLSIYNTPSATGNANLTAANMVVLTSAERTYTFQWTISLVTPGTSCTGNTTVELDAIYTDPNGAGTQTQNLGVVTIASSGNGTAGMVATGVDNIRAKTGTAVQYQTSNFTAGTGCSPAPTYKVYPVLSQVN
jgi:hypothetical protein